jgi:crossover junction endodeoxyribonuclease RuvC
MTILGIDPGTAITGFGVIRKKSSKIKYVKCGCITTCAGLPLPERLDCIYKDVMNLVRENKPEVVAVEELFFFKNVKTAIEVSHARGVIVLAAQKSGLPIFEYTPLQVKQALTGYGRADKKQIQSMVKNILGLNEVPKPDDAADALAVAICHAHSERLLKIKD